MCFTSFFFSKCVLLFSQSGIVGGAGGEANLKMKWFQDNTSWPLSTSFSLTGKLKKSEQGKQQYPLFATSNRVVFTATWKFAHYQGGFEEREREGSWLCTWCGSFLLVWSQLCLDLPLPFQPYSCSHAGPGQDRSREWMHLTVKGSRLIFICALRIFINPYMNMPVAPLSTADFQIKDLCCR